MFREMEGNLKYRFIVPGSCYSNCLWDWDSWLTNVALRQFVAEDIGEYERGCVLNYLEYCGADGRVPIVILPDSFMRIFPARRRMHKPCLAQHAAFIAQSCGVEWLRPYFARLERFCAFIMRTVATKRASTFGWTITPSAWTTTLHFYRPRKSSASIFLNCMMYKGRFRPLRWARGAGRGCVFRKREAENLRDAVRAHCLRRKGRLYYSADLNLLPIEPGAFPPFRRAAGLSCLIQRLGSWSGFWRL